MILFFILINCVLLIKFEIEGKRNAIITKEKNPKENSIQFQLR